jgi:uncharacterized membrane protein
MIPGLLVLAAAAAFSVWAYPALPAQVATHFDLHGEPNGWSSRLFASAMIPALGLLLAVVFTILPRIDPLRANYALFGRTYWTIANAVLVLLAGIHCISLGKALGWPVDVARVVPLGIGGMFVLLGSLMPRIQPNWFVGIRTPWTLSSATVWRKTHRFGGVVFVIAGLCLAATGVAASSASSWVLYGGMGVVAAAALGSVVYSYVVWRGEQSTPPPRSGQ